MKFEMPLPAEPSNGMDADGDECEEKNNDSWDETYFGCSQEEAEEAWETRAERD